MKSMQKAKHALRYTHWFYYSFMVNICNVNYSEVIFSMDFQNVNNEKYYRIINFL